MPTDAAIRAQAYRDCFDLCKVAHKEAYRKNPEDSGAAKAATFILEEAIILGLTNEEAWK